MREASAPRAHPRYPPVALLWTVLILCAALWPPATKADSRTADYDELLRWHYAAPRTLPDGGIVIPLDDAEIHLDEGVIRLQSPLENGSSYGLTFEGRGRFRMEIADEIELRQLRRFSREPQLQRIELELTALVVATSDPGLLGVSGAEPPFTLSKLARDRHEQWLRQELMDAASHVIEGFSDPGAFFARLDLRTADWGWVSLVYRARRREEIELRRFHPGHKTIESWLSLDRREDRLESGRPSYDYEPAFLVPHVDIVADVRQRMKESPSGFSRIQPVRAKLRTKLQVRSETDGLRALRLRLTPRAELTAVEDATGAVLGALRDAVGKRWSTLDSELQDDSLLVLLPRPLAAGESMTVAVVYELPLYGYAPGRNWYPGPEGSNPSTLAAHTTSLEIVHRPNQSVRASGVQRHEGGGRTLWVHDTPVRMSSFVVVGKSHEAEHRQDGVPDVRTFASLGGYMHAKRIDQVGVEVSDALDYFQRLFGDPLDESLLRCALIPSGHGQAFEAFLHVGEFTVARDSIAATTLFRAHEVAHQWWGHRVLWASYRDQWLSEAFAEYSAMLFVRDTLDDGTKQFEQILEAYTNEVLGSLESLFSQYARPDYTPLTRLGLERIGPTGHGYRSYVGEAPSAYFTQTYLKGALVLHSLRTLVARMTGNEDTFVEVLRAFLRRHRDSHASTEDFIAVLTQKVPADWSWFFDQWIYGSDIPTYIWRHEVAKGAESRFELRLHVEQQDVSPGFKMAVPVALTFSGGRTSTLLAFLDAPEKDLAFPLPERPSKVVFNPDHAVLARTRKR